LSIGTHQASDKHAAIITKLKGIARRYISRLLATRNSELGTRSETRIWFPVRFRSPFRVPRSALG
jgi:hypothetical protein